jgi:hypothetical protein
MKSEILAWSLVTLLAYFACPEDGSRRLIEKIGPT